MVAIQTPTPIAPTHSGILLDVFRTAVSMTLCGELKTLFLQAGKCYIYLSEPAVALLSRPRASFRLFQAGFVDA